MPTPMPATSWIKSITDDTKFNGQTLFGSTGFTFQVGANTGETISTVATGLSLSLIHI